MANNLCMAVAQDCKAREDAECPMWYKCDAIRAKVFDGVIALKLAIMDAESARAIGDEEHFDVAVQKAIQLVAEVHKQLKEMGLLK